MDAFIEGVSYGNFHPFLFCSKIGNADEKAKATDKALDMSLKYSFVTPLTSMVVTKPENDDSPMIADKLTEGDAGLTLWFFETNILPAEMEKEENHNVSKEKCSGFFSAVQQRKDKELNRITVRKQTVKMAFV